MARTLAQLQQDEDDILDALGTGALKVVYGDPPKQVTFRSVAELREALNVIRREIQNISGTRRPRKYHLTTGGDGWQA